MSDRTIVAVSRTSAAFATTSALVGTAVFVVLGEADLWWSRYVAFVALLTVSFAVLTWMLILRQPHNPVVWSLAAAAVFGGLYVGLVSVVILTVADDPAQMVAVLGNKVVPASLPTPAMAIRMVTEATGAAAAFIPLTFGLLLFPDGRLPSPRWRWVRALAAVGILTWVLGAAWDFRPWHNGLTGSDAPTLTNVGTIITFLATALTLGALVSRHRGSSETVRDQIKWVVWGASALVPAVVLAVAFGDTRHENLTRVVMVVATIVFVTSFGIAVGRHDLYDVDKVISRTVGYGIVVGVLGVVYAGSVFLLRAFLPWEGDVAVAASTLAVAALFNPLRHRIQAVVDRRFYRSRYDAGQVIDAFAVRLRDQVDLDALTHELITVVERTLQPSSTQVWLRPRPPVTIKEQSLGTQ